jgi:polygalacturonase
VSGARADEFAWKPPEIPSPRIPENVFSISDYGANGDGKTDNTKAITEALAACDKAGGGTVKIGAGLYFTGPFNLISNLHLQLDEGATLLFTTEKAAYPVGAFREQPKRPRPMIAGDKLHDIAITGKGKIDGQGEGWWKEFRALGAQTKEVGFNDFRPKMIYIIDSERIHIEGVTLTNSPMFHLVPSRCKDVTIEGISIIAPGDAPNTDACDPSGWNFIIRNSTFDVGDDDIVAKPSDKTSDGRVSCENIYIEDCTILHGHGISVGGQTPGGMHDFHVRNCTFDGTDDGIRLKAERGAGGLVENCTYENITMKNVKWPIYVTSYYHGLPAPGEKDPIQKVNEKTPIWRGIHIANLTVTDCPNIGLIMGLPEMPVQDLTIENSSLSGDKPLRIGSAKDIVLKNVKLSVPKGKPLQLEDDVSGEGLTDQ